jgi:hypothetical protein
MGRCGTEGSVDNDGLGGQDMGKQTGEEKPITIASSCIEWLEPVLEAE